MNNFSLKKSSSYSILSLWQWFFWIKMLFQLSTILQSSDIFPLVKFEWNSTSNQNKYFPAHKFVYFCDFFKTENVASLAPKITRLSPDSWVISRNVTLSWNSSLTPSPSLFLDIMAYQVHVLFICSSVFDESGLFSNFLLALVVLALCSL